MSVIEKFKIENETQADFVRTIKGYFEAMKEIPTQNTNANVTNYIKLPDGIQYKLRDLLNELERYEKEKEERINEG